MIENEESLLSPISLLFTILNDPVCFDDIIPEAVSNSVEQLKQPVLSMLSQIFQESLCLEKLEIDRLSGAMTNKIFKIFYPGHPCILLRIYGQGADQFISREKELYWLMRLSHLKVAPRIISMFGNGRFEEYIDSITLDKHLMREPAVSAKIAKTMAKLHLYGAEMNPKKSELWELLFDWHSKACHSLELMDQKDQSRLADYDISALMLEIQELQKRAKKIASPLVLCHNDTQYGNILQINESNALVIVDYEYCGINYRGFDIANHFCEWTADYHSIHPHVLDFKRFPSTEQQNRFLRSYMSTTQSSIVDEKEIQALKREVEFFIPCSHLMWAFWGIIQASTSTIDFDYIGYAKQRLDRFYY